MKRLQNVLWHEKIGGGEWSENHKTVLKKIMSNN